MSARVLEADCVEAMAAMDEASVDAIVCDPPLDATYDVWRIELAGPAPAGESEET